jgi:nitroimidazol reductase NimA-like FMN-containing flavoprotein (pyridoxamine 5'-phosphate oxidase superfamily)
MRTYDDWYPGHLKDLDERECRELLSQHLVGRVAWCHPTDGPSVLPVNYRFDGLHIVFRTSPHTDLARHFSQGRAAFQIDEFDEFTQSGWSVMARGQAEVVPWDEVPEPDQRPSPWVAGSRNIYVRIAVERLTGRRVLPA